MTTKNNDFLNEYIVKSCMIDIIKEKCNNNKYYNHHKKYLVEYIINSEYDNIVGLLSELGVRDYGNKLATFAKYGLAAIAGGVVGAKFGLAKKVFAPLGAVVYYQFRKITDPCEVACAKLPGKETLEMCRYKCMVKGCDPIIRDIQVQKSKCKTTKNPMKCERQLNKTHITWIQKQEDYKRKLDQARNKYLARGIEKKQKQLRKINKKVRPTQ